MIGIADIAYDLKNYIEVEKCMSNLFNEKDFGFGSNKHINYKRI